LPKPKKGKKKKEVSSDSESDVEMPTVTTGRTGRGTKQTKYVFESDESD